MCCVVQEEGGHSIAYYYYYSTHPPSILPPPLHHPLSEIPRGFLAASFSGAHCDVLGALASFKTAFGWVTDVPPLPCPVCAYFSVRKRRISPTYRRNIRYNVGVSECS